MGSPGSRARCFRTCSRSSTAQGPSVSRACDTLDFAFHLSQNVGTLELNNISRLNTWPARTPINASPLPCGKPTHDAGPVWFATPSPYDSFIRYTSPVLTGAFGTVYKTTGHLIYCPRNSPELPTGCPRLICFYEFAILINFCVAWQYDESYVSGRNMDAAFFNGQITEGAKWLVRKGI